MKNSSILKERYLGLKSIHLRVFLPFACGYFLSYLYRVVNAVIAPDLTSSLNLGPDDLGLLTAAYFITFAAAQIPLGMMLDRFGPRWIEAGLLIAAAGGALVFSFADSLAGLVAGRGLIGLGVSACLMAAFTAYARWFEPKRLPFVNGFQMAAGGLGVVTATVPVQAALGVTDWRGIFAILAALTAVVAMAIVWVVPERQVEGTQRSFRSQMQGMRNVFTSRTFWRIAPWAMISQATTMSIQGLWAGPWLQDVAGLSRPAAANVLMFMAFGMIAGYLALGWLSDRLSYQGVTPRTVAVIGMSLFMTTQLLIIFKPSVPVWVLWVAFAFFGTSGILCYSDLSQRFPAHMTGRVNTALNLLVFVAAFAAQWGIGIVLDQWPRTASGGYAEAGYQAGFGVIVLLQAVTLVLFLSMSRRSA